MGLLEAIVAAPFVAIEKTVEGAEDVLDILFD